MFRKPYIFILVACIVLILLGGYVFLFSTPTSDIGGKESLTNPIAHLVRNKSLSIGARVALQDEVKESAEKAITHGEISHYGVYYRELISGPVIALNQNEGFFPASLLKLPVAMWYYKQAEVRPDILSQQIEFSGPRGVTVGKYLSARTLEPGNRYTIKELIQFMLSESDNDATAILVEYAGGRDTINQVYKDVGIRNVEDYNTYVIDTQTYVAFFRVLYNAEYLTEEASQEILSMLTNTFFTDGIVRKLPKQTIVAHKFGERVLDPEGRVYQLHDCGVVYVPDNPYLLCIMTQGSDYDKMSQFISDMSLLIYSYATQEAS